MPKLEFCRVVQGFTLAALMALIASCTQEMAADEASETAAVSEEEAAEDLFTAAQASEDAIDIVAHAYEFLNTSAPQSPQSRPAPGLHSYILMTENDDSAAVLLNALFGSVRPLSEVQEVYPIAQINVFHVPIRGDEYDNFSDWAPETLSEDVRNAFDYDWSSSVIDALCEAAEADSSCGVLSGGPYLVTSLLPIQPDNSALPAPQSFLMFDLSTVPGALWGDLLETYKAAVIDAETLSDLRATSDIGSRDEDGDAVSETTVLQTFAGTLLAIVDSAEIPGLVERIALRVLRTTSRCYYNSAGVLVCTG